jgi:hypothetical protein
LHRSSVDFFAVADAKNENEQPIVFDLANKAIVADAVFPELPKPRAVQGLPDAAWVVQWRDAFIEEFQDARREPVEWRSRRLIVRSCER